MNNNIDFKTFDFKEKTEDYQVMKMTLLNLIVCSKLGENECLEKVKAGFPAGTSNNWQVSDRENQRPVKCADNPETNWHYCYVC